MERWSELDQVPKDFGETVVVIGNFDGVHRGHEMLLDTLMERARATNRKAVAVTFWPHPLHVHLPGAGPQLITGLDQRLDQLQAWGLDAILIVDYTLEFARQSPQEFVENYLLEGLNAKEVVAGQGIRFGWQNVGNLETMQELGEELGFKVTVQKLITEPTGRRWSSSWARELLSRGEVANVSEILGRSHTVSGTVVEGFKRGRELGFPTANLGADIDGFVPGDGVYAGWLIRADGQRLPAAISVGTNPTFENATRSVEAHVLDRDDLELYGELVTFEFVRRLRGNIKFDNADDLIAQMKTDVDQTRSKLGLAD